jgi:hypothetical protein
MEREIGGGERRGAMRWARRCRREVLGERYYVAWQLGLHIPDSSGTGLFRGHNTVRSSV